jgi:hypothetical protein
LSLAVAATSLLSALPAAGKDGVHATLTTKLRLDAPPGTKLHVAWRLAYVEDGKRRAFGGGGVFVRLRSATGGPPETGMANEDGGSYTATVAVPEGGIADVEVGIQGFTSGAYTGRSDLLFPITNDPLPGPPRQLAAPAPSRAATDRADRGLSTWTLAFITGVLVAIGTPVAVAVARRGPARATLRAGVRPR